MSKHTPGPWAFDYRKFNHVVAENGALVATCNRLTNLVGLEANARLIAAAPELLEALLEVVRVFESNPPSICDTVWVTGGQPETLFDHCRAAIAKATGAQQ